MLNREQARQEAIDWQNGFAEHNYSYEELVKWSDYFEKLAEEFDLTDEFHENGII